MSAFMIATITVKKPEKFGQYLGAVQKLASLYNAEVLTKGKMIRNITGGDSTHAQTLIVQFPDIEAIDMLFNSVGYQSLIPLREEAADIIMTSYQSN
ncbi:DUF1330 domain-containing protein [Paremcibacter congregatus]|uniref:DUF1330 domain-containing protein n=1 Tax=Paremcibacter congregatus TaxID=2043170 RepID=A0A2G4YNI5_9PROT|nr:DUF1330 domain-containing protein [Paremcibacter congregatus]PHZ83889.1 hypothetical protein CRD36_16195 [Paremcibacter congregatus]QDE27593.1 DUF1330 domain-containing protein [Paremcibacter congregatus]